MYNVEKLKQKHELNRMENIILKDLSAFMVNNSSVDEWLITDFKAALKDEAEEIKKNITYAMYCIETEHARESYIQYHQQKLINLAGDLLPYTNADQRSTVHEPSGIHVLSHLIYLSLEDLLAFMEIHCSKYFDYDTWVPSRYLCMVRHYLSVNIDEVHQNLITLGIDQYLLSIVMQPLNKIINTTLLNGTTYRKVIYLKQLKEELLELIHQQPPHPDINKSLHVLLHTLNFNSPEYFNYCTNYIKKELKSAEDSEADQVFILNRYQKYLYQIWVKPDFILETTRPPLAHQLIEWIDIEKKYRKSDDLIDADPVNDLFPRFKIIIDMPIVQLSYFINVLMKINIIQNKNKTAVSKFVPGIFQSTTKEGMAKGNVRKKLYAKEDSVKKGVVTVLKNCIQYIENNIDNNSDEVVKKSAIQFSSKR